MEGFFKKSLATDMIAKSSKLIATYLAVSIICAGCYPRPHKYIDSPAIAGVLLKGGIPAAGITVLLAQTRGDGANYCRGGRFVGVTDNAGRFRFDPSIHTHIFTSLLNPPSMVFQNTSVCFEIREQQKLGVVLMARTDQVKSFTLSCDWDSVPRNFKQDVIWSTDKWGICAGDQDSGLVASK